MVTRIVNSSLKLSQVHFRQQLQQSFILHRDLKSCLSLTEALQIYKTRQNDIKMYGKTAFLQFLNNFPLNHSFKMLSSPLKIYLYSVELQNLSPYENQLCYSVLLKLKEYVCLEQKATVQQMLDKQQKMICLQVEKKPYDTVHAINFLFFQKDYKNNQMFYHCLNIIKNTDYQLLSTVLPKITPLLLKRLSLNEWSIIRRFKYFLDHLVYEYKPEDIYNKNNLLILNMIASLQLHMIGYQRIPLAIDFILNQVCVLIDKDAIDLYSLQSVFCVFDLLPLTYNQKIYNKIYNKLLEKIGKQSIHIIKLPLRKMKPEQIKKIFEKILVQDYFFKTLIYFGNIYAVRKQILKTSTVAVLLKQFLMKQEVNMKNLSNLLIATSILFPAYQNNPQIKQQLQTHTRALIKQYNEKLPILKYYKSMSICSILHLIHINNYLKLDLHILINKIKKNTLVRAQRQLDDIVITDMLAEAVLVYSQSQQNQIIQFINSIVTIVAQSSKKFYFKHFSQIYFYLEKSVNSEHYQMAINAIFQKLQSQDCVFMAQIFNRFLQKNFKLNIAFLKKIWNKNQNFESIGKLISLGTFAHFTSPRGDIIYDLKIIIDKIQPLLNIGYLKQFLIPEITNIIRFSRHFYYSIPEFASKFLTLSLSHVMNLDIKREGYKSVLGLIQQAIKLRILSKNPESDSKKILKLLELTKSYFPNQLVIKIKQIEIKQNLQIVESQDKIDLLVQQILQELSKNNYDIHEFDTMLSLIRLHAFEMITLTKPVQQKLTALVIQTIQHSRVKFNSIIVNTSLLYIKGGTPVKAERVTNYSSILKMAISKVLNRQNFELYLHFLECGHAIKDTSLVKLALEKIIEAQLHPPQIRTLVKIIRNYQNIDIPEICCKLAEQTNNYYQFLQPDCAQILQTIYSLTNNIPKHKQQLWIDLFNKNEQYLYKLVKQNKIEKMKQNQKYSIFSQIMKHLWVAIKINKLSQKQCSIFSCLFNHKKTLISYFNKGKSAYHMRAQNSYLIILSLLKHFENEDLILKELSILLFRQLAGMNTIEEVNDVLNGQENQLLIKMILQLKRNVIKERKQNPINSKFSNQVNKLKLELVINSNEIKDNCYMLKREVNGVIIDCYIKDNGMEEGWLELSERHYNQNNQRKNQVDFIIKANKMITGINIKAVDIKLETIQND